jgi:hypothetical protein
MLTGLADLFCLPIYQKETEYHGVLYKDIMQRLPRKEKNVVWKTLPILRQRNNICQVAGRQYYRRNNGHEPRIQRKADFDIKGK